MNYRHIYHAGNFADVFKHIILCLILQHLRQKESPFCVLDTHAGIGLYDLQAPEAVKTHEAAEGILHLLKVPFLPSEIQPYLEAVRGFNRNLEQFRYYPGSPAIIRSFLRSQDRLVLAELHPEDVRFLKRNLPEDKRVAIHHMDGYQALKAFLPPVEKRGLVLIDPPFEKPDEWETLTKNLVATHQRWPTGIYAVWYPIKERPTIWRFEEALIGSNIRRILKAELLIHPEDTHLRLNGCGMMIINPPWKLDENLAVVLSLLQKTFAPTEGKYSVSWLIPE